MSSPPPKRLATAQALAQGRLHPVLHSSLRRVQQRMKKNFTNPSVQFGHGLSETGEAMKLRKIFTKLMLLPRGDLRSAFHGMSFATASEDNRRMEHVLNEFFRTGSARYVDLAELFPKRQQDDSPEETPSLDRRPDSGTATSSSATSTATSVETGKAGSNETRIEDECNEQEDSTSVRVLLIASAGCGKTTLMTKYCPMQWARGELWADKFDLVIAKEFRYEETRRVNGVADLLGGWDRVGVATGEDKQHVLDFVMDNPHRICLILDGLDETKLGSCSEYLQKVIRGEELCGIHLVLTSRATDDAFRLSELCPFDLRVELVGFLPSDVPEFVKRVLGGDLAEKLLAEIEKNPFLSGVMCTPYFAASICDLFKWRNQVPCCLSDVFELMILRIAERSTGKRHATWESVGEDVKKQIMDLGDFALHMLVDQKLVFSDRTLDSLSLSPEAVGLGMLVACERDGQTIERQWRFSHLSLQESLSALFVANCSDMYPRKVVCIVETLGPLSGHLETFWQLLSARLSAECMDCLVNSLLLRVVKPTAAGMFDCLLYDRENFPHTILDVMKSQFTQDTLDRLAEKLLDGLVLGSGALAVENEMQRGRQTSNTDFLKTLLVMWKNRCSEANVGVLLERIGELGDASIASTCATAIGLESTLQDVCLPMEKLDWGDDASAAREKLVFCCYAEYVQHIHSSGKMMDVWLPSLAAYLRLNFQVINSSMNVKDAFAVLQVVKHYTHDITEIRIQVRYHVHRYMHEILSLLPSCDNVSKLLFFYGGLDGIVAIEWLPGLIQRSALSLVHLSLSSFRLKIPSPFEVRSWDAIRLCTHLKHLSVPMCFLSPSCVPCMAASFAGMRYLETLLLEFEHLSDSDTRQLLSSLTTADLTDVTFAYMRAMSLPSLAAAIPAWPHLEKLVLTALYTEGITKTGTDAFLSAVNGHASLKHVIVGYCHTGDDEDQACIDHLTEESSYSSHLLLKLGRGVEDGMQL